MNAEEEQFEHVNSCKYLGTTVNTDSCVEGEITERIAAGNRAYRVHKKNIFIKINIPKRQTTTLYHVNSPNKNLCLRNMGD